MKERQPIRAGTAFLVDHAGTPVVLSALHLVGPAGGLDRQWTAPEIPSGVSLRLTDWKTGELVTETSAGRLLSGASLDPTNQVTYGDLMAFDVGGASGKKGRRKKRAPATELAPLPLDGRCPAPGETVWIVGPSVVQQGKVAECAPWQLLVSVTEDFQPDATSGAPWVDAQGRVVGMNLGSGTLEDLGEVAFGIPGLALLARLDGTPLPEPVGSEPTHFPWQPNPWGMHLEGLHEVLLPEWGISGRDEEAIRAELGKSDVLGPLFAEFSKLAWASSAGNYEELNALLDRWNGVYEDAGIPYRSHIGVGRGNQMAFMTQKLLATVSDGEEVALVVVRLDQLNIFESPVAWGEDRAEVRPRGVRDELVVRVVAHLDDEGLAGELGGVLTEEALSVLQKARPHAAALAETRRSINARSRCSRVSLPRVGWVGIDEQNLERLKGVIGTGRCAGVLQSEHDALGTHSRALRELEGFDEALGELLVHALRSFAVVALDRSSKDVRERTVSGWTRAMTDSASQHTARALACAEEHSVDVPACGAPLPDPVEIQLTGLPETLPVTWGGR